MKNLISLILTLAFFIAFSINSYARPMMHRTALEDSVHIWVSQEMFEVANMWASAFEQKNPGKKISISTVTADKVAFMIEKSEGIGLVTKDYMHNESTWQLIVGKDILVPIINTKNPFADQILKRGISPSEFVNIYSGATKHWNELLKTDQSNIINFYHCNSELNKSQLSNFLHTDLQSLDKTNIETADDLIEKIQSDKYSIGFCKLADIVNTENYQIKEGLNFIPIDKNNNHKVDYAENIYTNLSEFERGVWIGKYPNVLLTKLYTIASKQPTNNNEIEFINWIITDGQELLLENGFSRLVSSELHSNLQRLYDQPVSIEEPNKAKPNYTLIILLVLVAAILIVPFFVFTSRRNVKPVLMANSISEPGILTESSVIVPNGLFFDRSHTWAFMEKDGNIRIGIADFLQHITGKITKVDMKSPGESVKKGEPLMILKQEGKQLAIPSPITGKIRESNLELETKSSKINSAPYSEGWVYLIESDSWLSEIKSFFIGQSYREWLSEEIKKLKKFFSTIIKLSVDNKLEMILQDGGELNDNPLEGMSPLVWEEFQSRFLNHKSKLS